MTYTEQVMNRFHELNKLYDSTMNEIHHFMLSMDVSSNKCFIFNQAMKQDDRMSFIEATEK